MNIRQLLLNIWLRVKIFYDLKIGAVWFKKLELLTKRTDFFLSKKSGSNVLLHADPQIRLQ